MSETCQICSAVMTHAFTGVLLERHQVFYHHCQACGFLRTQNPTWLDEAYTNAIADTDTGLVVRNLRMARAMTVILTWLGERNGPFVDLAGGYGLFVRLMRDAGFPFLWEDKYASNLLAKGYESTHAATASAVTAFEVLEHIHDPVAFLSDAIARWRCRRLFLSTELYVGAPPPPGTWRYYAPETGQHISFYTTRTLQAIAGRVGLRYQRLGPVHAFLPPNEHVRLLPFLAGKPAWFLGPLLARRHSLTDPDHQEQVRRLLAGKTAGER